MEEKAFKQISNKILKDYGFIKKGPSYFLILPDILIGIRIRTFRGVRAWSYWIAIHALHNDDTPIEKRFDTFTEVHLEHSKSLNGYHKYEILVEQYSEEYYSEMFTQTLHNEFDPYKEHGIEYLKNNCLFYLHLSSKALQYLGPNEHREFIGRFCSYMDIFNTNLDVEYSNYSKKDEQTEYTIYLAYHCVKILWNREQGVYQIKIERFVNDEKSMICITRCSKYKQEVAEYIKSNNLNSNSLQDNVSYLAKLLNEYINAKRNICNEYEMDLIVDGIMI